jgi:ABC-type enterobactin transport system permease subunit
LRRPLDESGDFQEGIMQMAITFMAVVGGLVFSLAVALLAEEIIFGQVFRLFFASGKLARAAAVAKAEQKH